MADRVVVIDCRGCEGMREILRRVEQALTRTRGCLGSLERDELLESISAHLAPRPDGPGTGP